MMADSQRMGSNEDGPKTMCDRRGAFGILTLAPGRKIVLFASAQCSWGSE